MIAGTHLAFAATLYLGGAALFEYRPDLVSFGLALGASLLPDVDLPTSKVGRMLYGLSTRLERRFGHRTLTHSALAVLIIALLASPLLWLKPLWFGCVVGGYWSHIWLDMLNIRGTDLFWPSPVRVVMPGNRAWRMEVGSKAEMVLMTCLFAASLALYPVSGLGFHAGLQRMLGNFDMAREHFVKGAGHHWYTLELEATDTLTLAPVICDCPVLGVWQQGLIVLHEGRPRAVGLSQVHHDLYPLNAKLIEGEALSVASYRVAMRGRSLGWLLERIDPERTYYLSGELRIGGKATEPVNELDLYHPAKLSGDVLKLHYARREELTRYTGLVAAEGEVYVQFWLRPGDEVVTLSLSEEGREDVIPKVLQSYL